MPQSNEFVFQISRDGQEPRTERLDQDVIKVGSYAQSHLHVDDPAVSRMHALIERTADGVTIMDLGSGRGTTVNGVRVNKSPLRHGDRIGVGSTEILFQLASELEPKGVPPSEIVPDEVLYARRFLSKPATTDGSVEIAILYRDFVMHEEIFQPPRPVILGSDRDAVNETGSALQRILNFPWLLEHPSVGRSFRVIDVPEGGGEPVLRFAPGMEGEVYVDTKRMSLEEARHAEGARVANGAVELPLRQETRARLVFGDVVLFVHRSTRPAVILPAPPGAMQGVGYGATSVILHALFLALVFLLPPDIGRLSLDGFDDRNRFVQLLMQEMMEEEEELPDWLQEEEEQPDDESEAGEEGRAGDERAELEEDSRMAVERTEATPEQVELAREAVQDRGALAVLNQVGPTSLFGDEASGYDDLMAIGSVTGDDMGVAYGMRGLGRYGGGLHAGGTSMRAGFGSGALAIGGRTGGDDSLGRELRQVRERETREVAVTPGNPEIRGQLDREIIQRVIREHRREIRACYEAELQRNPNLRGRVAIEFVIAPDGSVASATVAESSMNSREVEACVTTRMRRWRFPEPRGGGIVRVTYPFDFTT